MSQFPNQKLTYKEKVKEYGSIEEWVKDITNDPSKPKSPEYVASFLELQKRIKEWSDYR